MKFVKNVISKWFIFIKWVRFPYLRDVTTMIVTLKKQDLHMVFSGILLLFNKVGIVAMTSARRLQSY